MDKAFIVRLAVRGDRPVLSVLIEQSVRTLQRDTYTPSQIELALAHVYGVDTTLIDDGTYFVIENAFEVVACGGWSKRATLHGGDRFAERDNQLLNPACDAARIRAFFVRPTYERRGLGSLLLQTCEGEAIRAGFGRAELSATLAGVPFYGARGYVQVAVDAVNLAGGESLPVVRMERAFP